MARDNPRRHRLAAEIQRELAELLRRSVKDASIGNVTITHVELSGDLREARVYFLPFAQTANAPQVQRGLTRAVGFLRNALGKTLGLRYTPNLEFLLDNSLEQGMRVTELIEKVKRETSGEPHDE